ncbi:uncharacterized protein [Typha angustifolia]|uniref:uncharacterized protein n=1 Tax=Typha angustifolia TaxID=59011 RepID=UPI003C301344
MGIALWGYSLLFFTWISLSWGLNSEGEALLDLSRNLILPSSINSTWNSSDPTPCRWEGIICDSSGRVVSFVLADTGISGSLGPEIGVLRYLQKIDLSLNSISGSIPSELGNCTFLGHLDISTNSLFGEIPATLYNLKNLSYLSLFDNSLSGKIPESLFHNTNLKTVYLNQNNLTGPVPSSIGNLTNVRILWLSQNVLSSVLPLSIGNLTKLEELYLFDNQLTGHLPKSLGAIRGLKYVDISANGFVGEIPFCSSSSKLEDLILSFNQFKGEIPIGLGNCSSLVTFAAASNILSGHIPPSIGSLTNLSILYLFMNSLSGLIPPEIGNCRLLTDLQLHENQLEGAIPKEMGNLTILRSLFLHRNHLTGEVPVGIWRIPSLEMILIYSNSLSGELPLEMTELRNLQNISLFDNKFTGVIPQGLGINSSLVQIDFTNNSFVGGIPPGICFGQKLIIFVLGFNLLNGSIPLTVGNCSSLERLIVQNNNLTGSIPEFATTSRLLYMDLSANKLNGYIPRSLRNCVNLTLINWSRNGLSGPIPKEIGNLVNLQVLNFSHNRLYGPLPPQISQCTSLYLLDLSFNSLNGSIPSALTNLKLLSRLVLQENQFSGGIPDFLSGFNRLIELQFGGNILGGSIPSSLGTLLNVEIALNLSGNGLTGHIPGELGNLIRLQSLDLSLNNLNGSLFPLSDLSLLYVNVSYNDFTGPVPENFVKLLNSSPSSFLGNPNLCISCLSGDSSCVKNSVLKPCSTTNNTKGINKIKIAMIALGSLLFSVLVLLVLAYAIFKHRNRKPEEGPSLHDGSSLLFNKVMEATENLNEKYVLGRGAHGTVYRASVSPEKVYAVKKIVFSSQQGANASMIREIQTVGRIRHRNLVKLVDFWLRRDYGLILYDYMENGSLHDVLHEIKPPPVLQWNTRYQIALGTAQGLAYLHNDCNPAIIHRDIKPKNILLDKDMEPHIADFGIAKLIDQISASPQSSVIMGTIGYMSPETAFTTRKSKESDVYSYGVVLLELITRKKALDPSFPENNDITSWVQSTLGGSGEIEEISEPNIFDELMGSADMEEVHKVLLLALRCTSKEASERPSMRNVVKELTDIKSNAGHIPKQRKLGSQVL